MSGDFYIVLVETNEEPVPLQGPFSTYDEAVDANYANAIESGYEPASDNMDAHLYYQYDDAVRIGRVVVEVGRTMANPEPTVDEQGFVVFAGERLSQAAAIGLAYDLTAAVEKSIDRNQIGTPGYHSSGAIERRQHSSLGQAKAALKAVFGNA